VAFFPLVFPDCNNWFGYNDLLLPKLKLLYSNSPQNRLLANRKGNVPFLAGLGYFKVTKSGKYLTRNAYIRFTVRLLDEATPVLLQT